MEQEINRPVLAFYTYTSLGNDVNARCLLESINTLKQADDSAEARNA
jgi:hypothetical protein